VSLFTKLPVHCCGFEAIRDNDGGTFDPTAMLRDIV
jgi:hypothetical protein